MVDANQGFCRVQLDDDSSKLCTFNTPLRTYSFPRFTFRISSAPEVFQRCLSQYLEGLEGVVNVIEDIMVWGLKTRTHTTTDRKSTALRGDMFQERRLQMH